MMNATFSIYAVLSVRTWFENAWRALSSGYALAIYAMIVFAMIAVLVVFAMFVVQRAYKKKMRR